MNVATPVRNSFGRATSRPMAIRKNEPANVSGKSTATPTLGSRNQAGTTLLTVRSEITRQNAHSGQLSHGYGIRRLPLARSGASVDSAGGWYGFGIAETTVVKAPESQQQTAGGYRVTLTSGPASVRQPLFRVVLLTDGNEQKRTGIRSFT